MLVTYHSVWQMFECVLALQLHNNDNICVQPQEEPEELVAARSKLADTSLSQQENGHETGVCKLCFGPVFAVACTPQTTQG